MVGIPLILPLPAPTGPTLCARRWCLLLPLFLSYPLLFSFAAMPSPVGRVVARPAPVFFLAHGGLGWWLFLLGSGYPLPTPIVCAHYAHVMHSRVMGSPAFFIVPHCVYLFFFAISYFFSPTISPPVGSSGGSPSSPFYFLAHGPLGWWIPPSVVDIPPILPLPALTMSTLCARR